MCVIFLFEGKINIDKWIVRLGFLYMFCIFLKINFLEILIFIYINKVCIIVMIVVVCVKLSIVGLFIIYSFFL